MISEIDKAIASGALSINKILDKDRHRTRDINIKHPKTKVYHAVKLQANAGSTVNIESDLDDDDVVNIPTIFDGDLADIDW